MIRMIQTKFKIDKKNFSISVPVNPKVFPLEVVYSAAYIFLDRAYVMIDGDPKRQILVQLKAKNKKENLMNLASEFNNELVSYAVYVVQAARTSGIRQAIVQRALGTVEEAEKKLEEESTLSETEAENDFDYIRDPLGIAKPWTSESAKGLKNLEEIKNAKKHKGR